MKYHIAVKFLAILLCAACLLGAVGGAAGMVILSEGNLYNNTVEEVLEQEIRSSAQFFARQAAMHYASVELGGCPEDFVSHYYTNQWDNSYYDAGNYGYVIRDAEGNVVAGSDVELAETGKRYAFPVSSQYMYLVSMTPKAEERHDVEYGTGDPESPLGGAYGVYDALPASDATAIYGITIGFEGSSTGYGSADAIGVAVHDPSAGENAIVFYMQDSTDQSLLREMDNSLPINYIALQDISGNVVYEVSTPTGEINWEFDFTDGHFVCKPNISGGTAPSNQHTSVYLAEFYSLEDPEQAAFVVYGDDAIGELYYDASGVLNVTLQSILEGGAKVSGAVADGWVSGVCLYDVNGELILEDRTPGLVALAQDGMLYYHTSSVSAIPTQSVDSLPAEAPAAQSVEAEDGTQEDAQQPEENETGDETPEAEGVPEEQEGETGEPAEPEEGETQGEATETVATEPEPTQEETVAPEEVTEPVAFAAAVSPTEPELINGKPLTDYEINTTDYYDWDTSTWMTVKYVYTPMPEYTVELYVAEGTLHYSTIYTLLEILRNYRSDMLLILGASLLLFVICAVYLCCAAGHKPKQEEIRAGGLCRMPIDLNLAISAGALVGLAFCGYYGMERILAASIETGLMTMAGVAYLASLCVVQLLYCVAAQFKTPGGYWWRNSVCGRILLLVGKLLKWMIAFLPGKVVKFVKAALSLVLRILRFLWRDVIVKAARGIAGGVRKFMGLLPLIWQWLLVGCLMVLVCAISAAGGALFLGIVVCLCIVLYMSYCFGVLLKSAKRMGKGDLNTKVDDKRLIGCFEEFAGDLNDLADVAVVAAQKQLKSERMKTELITNVSHDIKTPLTSIINYVDLLQKPHTEEEEAVYLEVLARQSQRLKKLIEDLMEMSKASTGNMSVDITTLDAVEAVNQALGEFGDKLSRAELIPVFRHSQESVMIRADGRLVWRVLSNLLGNAVKYAMPGTRLYIDLMEMEGNVIISLKNISRDELNVDSEELMERFVRGDDSRNTEGSGLGLNIAKSLMELQKGQLQLLVDGDLFKVTLIFPGA